MKPAGQREKCGERDRQGVGDTERQRHEGGCIDRHGDGKNQDVGTDQEQDRQKHGGERKRDIETWDGDMEGQMVIE